MAIDAHCTFLASAPVADVVLSSTVRIRYVAVSEAAKVAALTVDATHVYWLTDAGVFRRAK